MNRKRRVVSFESVRLYKRHKLSSDFVGLCKLCQWRPWFQSPTGMFRPISTAKTFTWGPDGTTISPPIHGAIIVNHRLLNGGYESKDGLPSVNITILNLAICFKWLGVTRRAIIAFPYTWVLHLATPPLYSLYSFLKPSQTFCCNNYAGEFMDLL